MDLRTHDLSKLDDFLFSSSYPVRVVVSNQERVFHSYPEWVEYVANTNFENDTEFSIGDD